MKSMNSVVRDNHNTCIALATRDTTALRVTNEPVSLFCIFFFFFQLKICIYLLCSPICDCWADCFLSLFLALASSSPLVTAAVWIIDFKNSL